MGDHAITLLREHSSGPAGKAPTFDELFNSHHEKVLKAAYRVTGNLQDAEDVLQTVFLRLLKRKDRPDLGANSAAYLCWICYGRATVHKQKSLMKRSTMLTQVQQIVMSARQSRKTFT